MRLFSKIGYHIKALTRSIFGFVDYVLFNILAYSIRIKEIKSDRYDLIIIKSDEIGDYLLFRNYLWAIKELNSKYKIALIGNLAYSEIALHYDKQLIQKFIWIDKPRYNRSFKYRISIYKLLRKLSTRKLICPTYSRNFNTDDFFTKLIKSDEKIGFKTDLSNQFLWQNKISNKIFTNTIELSNDIVFESDRSKYILNESSLIKSDTTKISIGFNRKYDLINEKYIVVFPSARYKYKIWSYSNFIELIRKIISDFDCKVVLSGGVSDLKYTDPIIKSINSPRLFDLCGKTNLIELIDLIGNAELLISNDTSVVHISASTNTNVVVILNGTHFGRFCPYPESVSKNVTAIYPEPIESRKTKEFDQLVKEYSGRSQLDINTVPVEYVYNKVKSILDDNPTPKYPPPAA